MQDSSPVYVYKEYEGGKLGLGVRVTDEQATLADLLSAWEPLSGDPAIYKAFAANHYADCRGCQVNCCRQAYVIPDLIALKRMSAYLGIAELDFARNYLDAEKLGITIPRLQTSPCIFLQEGLCTVYPVRTLICRFYLCTQILGETEEFIYTITLAGMAATQQYLAEAGLFDEQDGQVGLTDYEQHFLRFFGEYRGTRMVEAFLGARDYTEIPLSLFLPASR